MELIHNKEYTIKHTDQFCTIASVYDDNDLMEKEFREGKIYILKYVGKITVNLDKWRNVFVTTTGGLGYFMFGDDNHDYIVNKEKVNERIGELEKQISEMRKDIKSYYELLNNYPCD